jgi:hypothetical protein
MRIDAHHHLWTLDRGDYGWLTPAPIRAACKATRRALNARYLPGLLPGWRHGRWPGWPFALLVIYHRPSLNRREF